MHTERTAKAGHDAIGPLPVDDGATVVIDTVVSSQLGPDDLAGVAGAALTTRGGASDLVIVAVPAGHGVTTEFFLRRALQIEHTTEGTPS